MSDEMYLGFVPLWRKTKNNPIFRRDLNAWHVFEVLMLSVDRISGEWSGGRFTLADLASMNPNTAYKALKRLEKAKMVTLSSNNKFTTISICKWSQYQLNGNTSWEQPGNNQVTTREQQGNTITISNKKEERSKNSTNVLPNEPFQLVEHVREVQGIKPFPSKEPQFQAAKRIFRAGYSLDEACMAADRMHDDDYWADRTFDVIALARHIARYTKEKPRKVASKTFLENGEVITIFE